MPNGLFQALDRILSKGNIHKAAAAGDAKTLARLLGADASLVNSRGPNYKTPLHLASAHGRWTVIDCLLKCGANPNAQCENGTTPLMQAWEGCLALERGNDFIHTFKLLIAGGADINARADDGSTLLLRVISECNAGTRDMRHTPEYRWLVHYLLENHVDVNTHGTVEQITPLYAAIMNIDLDTARLLIHSGADINVACGKDNATVLYDAAGSGAGGVVAVKFCLENGADPHFRLPGLGWTPLHKAATGGTVEIAELLLLHGADVNARTIDEITPLALARFKLHTAIANTLSRSGGI